jgi:hypothetical protein
MCEHETVLSRRKSTSQIALRARASAFESRIDPAPAIVAHIEFCTRWRTISGRFSSSASLETSSRTFSRSTARSRRLLRRRSRRIESTRHLELAPPGQAGAVARQPSAPRSCVSRRRGRRPAPFTLDHPICARLISSALTNRSREWRPQRRRARGTRGTRGGFGGFGGGRMRS